MKKIVTFGEIMLRLQPYDYKRFIQTESFEATFGGGEANVAVSLATFGMDAQFITKLPDHAIGQMAVNSLRRYGVGTENIVRGGERVGIYFIEKGASQRGSVCIYDRAHSAIAEATREDFDWDRIFEGAQWFHFTGITPAIAPQMTETCEDACKAAKRLGVKISCDLNYRSKLWTVEQASEAMQRLCGYVDVFITNEWHARDIFSLKEEMNTDGNLSVARQLAEKFGFEKVAVTMRESISASENKWQAMLYDAASDASVVSKQYDLQIIDRVGGGDSFAAGLIYGIMNGKSDRDTVEFASAACALKHSIPGDCNFASAAETEALAGGSGNGMVQR